MIYNKNNSKTEEQLFTTLLMMTLYLSVGINVANFKTGTKKKRCCCLILKSSFSERHKHNKSITLSWIGVVAVLNIFKPEQKNPKQNGV